MEEQQKYERADEQVTWIILYAVEILHVGKHKLAAFLKGSQSREIERIRYNHGYGELMQYTLSTILGFIEQLEHKILIKKSIIPGQKFGYSILELTDAGKQVLEEKLKIPLQIVLNPKPIIIGNSEKETLLLLNSGKKISEIAKERNLAESTIYTHAFRLIVHNCLSVLDIFTIDIFEKVIAATEKFPSIPSVKEVKELLPELSYDEIRCSLAELRKKENNHGGMSSA